MRASLLNEDLIQPRKRVPAPIEMTSAATGTVGGCPSLR